MEFYLQGVAAVLLAAVLGLTLANRSKEYGIMLTIAVCCMVLILALFYLDPVLAFLQELEALAGLDQGILPILLKVTGIGLVGEIAALVCSDSGNSSLGKAVQVLGSGTILWMAIPIFRSLVELLQQILGEL